ncbi:phospholipase effector Tle1 domain-containing protein [Photobacterium sp. TLY01]|uniref:phospholipase effector Tle1 domain-containing protein n=1 Tax=Photobacterium sp. TLY01 TaxID=2907534 RepID=UPI001F31ECDB|nr:DUF2235 domain-containing protein [Photobacterium sp. TLY01]UIP29989.1 DUF2235 domain-containing protein [Photobacterium sp. TLY01]
MSLNHNKSKRFVKAGYQPLEDYSPPNKSSVTASSHTRQPVAEYVCNLLIYCSLDELGSLQTGCWTLKRTATENAVTTWQKSPGKNGHSLLTASCAEQEEKQLLHEVFQQAGFASSYRIQPQPTNTGHINAEFVPVKLAVQLEKWLGWPTLGYFYYFCDNKLTRECKLTGEDRWSFQFTRSDATTLTDELLSDHHYSSLLLPYQIEGQPVSGQYILFRKQKLSGDEFARLSPTWLEAHAVALDMQSIVASRTQALLERSTQDTAPPENTAAKTHHTVKMQPDTRQRESWSEIAEQYGLTARQLLDLNPQYSEDPLKLQIGDSLQITELNRDTQPKQPDSPSPLTGIETGKGYPFGNVWGTYTQRYMMPNLLHIQENSQILAQTPVVNTTQIKQRILRIGVFFDGTGQNKDNDLYKETYGNKSRSNIGRLFEAYPDVKEESYAIYVSGVGTVDGAHQDPGEIDDGDDEKTFGQALGVFDTTGAFAKWQNLLKQLANIIKKLDTEGSYDAITHIEFDVFGFSRGAALARHFVNAALKGLPDYTRRRRGKDSLGITPNLLGTEDPHWFNSEQGYELDTSRQVSVRFVGLFDTVGSFYWPGNADEGNFQLVLQPDCAQSVVQLCAHHEFRVNFPLTTLKTKGTLPDNFYEEVFPGAHSDVGGGYSAIEQYNKKGLDERYEFPMLTTYNREWIKSESLVGKVIHTSDGVRTVPDNPDSKLIPYLEFFIAEREPGWIQHCQESYGQYGAIKRDKAMLHYYRLQPVNNALSGLTQERMKQQAESIGIKWIASAYEQPKDFVTDDDIQQLWQKLAVLPVGSISQEHWQANVEKHGHKWIHRPHDALINPGYFEVYEWLVNKPNRNDDDKIVREIFENA